MQLEMGIPKCVIFLEDLLEDMVKQGRKKLWKDRPAMYQLSCQLSCSLSSQLPLVSSAVCQGSFIMSNRLRHVSSVHMQCASSGALRQLSCNLSCQLCYVNSVTICQLSSTAMCQLSCYLSTQLLSQLQLDISAAICQLFHVNSAAIGPLRSTAMCQLGCTLSAQLPPVNSAVSSTAIYHLSCQQHPVSTVLNSLSD